MRLAHLADIHLGFRQYYRQTASGINQREADVANAFRRAIDGVILAAPDLVLVAGDLFHAVRPSNQSIVFCFREFQRLKVALPNAKVLLIAGNHDTPRATETGSILRLFAELGIEVLAEGGWTYVALGHYHVIREVRPGVWYSGALDYVTLNPWGELTEQQKTGVKGKGWLLADLDQAPVTPIPQYVAAARGIYDLKAISGRDLTAAELDAQIAQRLAAVPGGIADQIIRLVVHDVPRHVAREVDHAAIRAAKASALHFHLDLRRPDAARTIGVGAPGPRQTLSDVLRVFLARRPLPEKVDRDRFVERGVALLDAVGYEPGPGG